jgi:hypothetical protein
MIGILMEIELIFDDKIIHNKIKKDYIIVENRVFIHTELNMRSKLCYNNSSKQELYTLRSITTESQFWRDSSL